MPNGNLLDELTRQIIFVLDSETPEITIDDYELMYKSPLAVTSYDLELSQFSQISTDYKKIKEELEMIKSDAESTFFSSLSLAS